MNFYLSAVDDLLRHPDGKLSLGYERDQAGHGRVARRFIRTPDSDSMMPQSLRVLLEAGNNIAGSSNEHTLSYAVQRTTVALL